MASDDVQTNLRIPADLKDRLTRSAEINNRSLSAEVTSRLAASFEESRVPSRQAIEAQVGVALARADTLSLRADLLLSRMDNIRIRMQLISSEVEQLTRNAKSDADFVKVEAGTAEFNELEEEIRGLYDQAQALNAERDTELAKMKALQSALREYEGPIASALIKSAKP